MQPSLGSTAVPGLEARRPRRDCHWTRIARRRAEEKRGDTHLVPERRRSRRTPKHDPQRPGLRAAAWTSEGADAFFVCERDEEGSGFPAQSSASGASHQARSEQSNSGSRAAVLRRSEPTRFSLASDDEIGGFPA
jgi:hypothetical protein